MHFTPVGVISLFAASLSMVSYVPQAWGIIRTRSTEGVSLKMYVITVCCFVLWLIYGILVGQWPIIVQNVICLMLSVFILTMKLLPKRRTAELAAALDPTGLPPEPS